MAPRSLSLRIDFCFAVSKLVTRSARLLGRRVSLLVEEGAAEGCSCGFCEGEEAPGALADVDAGDAGSADAATEDGREE